MDLCGTVCRLNVPFSKMQNVTSNVLGAEATAYSKLRNRVWNVIHRREIGGASFLRAADRRIPRGELAAAKVEEMKPRHQCYEVDSQRAKEIDSAKPPLSEDWYEAVKNEIADVKPGLKGVGEELDHVRTGLDVLSAGFTQSKVDSDNFAQDVDRVG